MKKLLENADKCPCDSGKSYCLCCQAYLEQTQQAPTAEALMRSRYTAFTQQNEHYLRFSWHPDTCPQKIRLSENITWLGLTIKDTVDGLSGDETGTVEFVARSKINGKAQRLHENSRFVRTSNRWLYIDGEFPTK